MDPDVTLENILRNLARFHATNDPMERGKRRHLREKVIDDLVELAEWLRKGSFPPQVRQLKQSPSECFWQTGTRLAEKKRKLCEECPRRGRTPQALQFDDDDMCSWCREDLDHAAL